MIIITEELIKYGNEQLEKSGIQIVPGHHPGFKTKKEIDDWIKFMEFFANKNVKTE